MSSARSQKMFFRRVGEALSPYQLIETILKFYIERAHLRIQRLVAGKVPFNYPPEEYENAPLERLIKMFRRHSDNHALADRLKKALKSRNYIAHNVIKEYMENHEKAPARAAISKALKNLEREGYELAEELQKELRKLDDFEDAVRRVLSEKKGT